MKFSNVVRSEAELRGLMGNPVAPSVVEKTMTSLDRHCFAFIGRAPLVFVATSDAEGRTDISPKGDAPGFVKVLDNNTLVIPDRPGNPSRGLERSTRFAAIQTDFEKSRDTSH